MLQVSDTYKNSPYSADTEYFNGTLNLLNGNSIPLNNDNIVKNSFTFSEKAVMGENFEVGGAYVGEVSMSLFLTLENPFMLTGATIYIERCFVYGTETVTIPIGHFSIDTSSVSRTQNTVIFNAYDNLIKLDVPVPNTYNNVTNTLSGHISTICSACGVSFTAPTNLANLTQQFTYVKPENRDFNCRDIIVFIAQLLGCFVRANRQTGAIEFIKFEATVDYTINENNAIQRSVSDTAVTVTGVQFNNVISGTQGYILDLSNNPFLTDSTTGLSDILGNVLSMVSDIEFYNAEITWFGDLSVQTGDCISYEQENLYGGNRTIIVMSNTYHPTTPCTIYSYGSDTQYAGYSPAYQGLNAIAQTLDFIKLNYLSANQIEAQYATISNLEVTNSFISRVESTANEALDSANNIQVGGVNYLRNSQTLSYEGYTYTLNPFNNLLCDETGEVLCDENNNWLSE